MNVIKDHVIVWEVPADMKTILVELFNPDNSFANSFTITNYITVKPGQKVRITSK